MTCFWVGRIQWHEGPSQSFPVTYPKFLKPVRIPALAVSKNWANPVGPCWSKNPKFCPDSDLFSGVLLALAELDRCYECERVLWNKLLLHASPSKQDRSMPLKLQWVKLWGEVRGSVGSLRVEGGTKQSQILKVLSAKRFFVVRTFGVISWATFNRFARIFMDPRKMGRRIFLFSEIQRWFQEFLVQFSFPRLPCNLSFGKTLNVYSF